MLDAKDLCSGYGSVPVLRNVSLSVDPGEIILIVGENGAGKTTLLRTLGGFIAPTSGSVSLGGEDITGLPPEFMPDRGLRLVLDGHRVFPELSVLDNLRLGAIRRITKANFERAVEEVFAMFPVLRQNLRVRARDLSGAVYPQSGVRDGFHVASHHSNARAAMDKYALINKYHVQMLAYFLGKLQATPDGDGTLLDHSMILYGSSMSNGNQHDHDPLPLILAGGASGQLNGGRHLKFAPHTPASNLLLSMLDKLGVHQDKHGDSTGKLDV